jgi:hypothetical protein
VPDLDPIALAEKARSARAGECILCGCTSTSPCTVIIGTVDRHIARRPCWWIEGSAFRLCDAHPSHHVAAASRALKTADQEGALRVA